MRFRNLEKYKTGGSGNNMTLGIPLPKTPDGRVYRYAISLFCPDCGAPNIHLHFAREAELAREQVELAGKLGPERQELAYRMMGNAHEDVLTAFEATLKTVYLYKVAARETAAADAKPVGNAFQNIERGRKRFAEFDFDPFGDLSSDALAVLTLNIQKRHVIGHNLGVADATFAEHAGEARLGETVPLVGDDILQFAGICQLVVDGLDAWLAGGEAAKTLQPAVRLHGFADRRPTGPPGWHGRLRGAAISDD
jgi:hypothetical protein